MVIGTLGALTGGALGLGGLAIFARPTPGVVATTALVIVAAVCLTCLVAVIPARSLRRLPTAQLLAQE